MSDPGALHLLHVDDDRVFVEMVTEYLVRADDRFTVTTETSVADGLARLETREFDCIVSDYDLPNRTGIDFLEAVREDHPDLPFILFTGKGSEAVAGTAISAGATDYLQKGTGTSRYELLANRILNAIEQHRARQRASELDRIRTLVSDVNQALVRASSRREAETRVCEIISDSEPYVFAWIGDLDPETGQVTPRASAGIESGYLEQITVTADETATGRGPGGRALRERQIAVSQDVADDPLFAPWRDDALERGFRATAAVPLVYDDGLYGELAVYSHRRGAFDEEERELLTSLSENIGHAIHSFRVQERLRNERDRRQALVENAPSPVLSASIRDDGDSYLVRDVNDAFSDVFGYEPAAVVGTDPAEFILPDGEREAHEAFRTRVTAGEALVTEVQRTTGDGPRSFLLHIIPYGTHEGHPAGVYAWYTDISDRRERERTIERLHTSARALMEAETTEAIAQRTVDAARDVLGMPINGIVLYDERDDCLRSVAWTAEVEEIADEMPTYPRGDGLAWEVFETGEKQIHDDVSQAPGRLNPETNVRSQMLLPLGEHGTLLVSSRTVGAFDETDVSLAQTLASHATTALTRLAHEQELKREHNRFEALFETIPEPVINVAFTDEGTLLRDVNEAFEEIFGYAKCDVVGADVNDLIVPETEAARAEAEHIDERASSGAQLTHEVQRETTDGLRDFLFRSAPVRESDQTPQQFGVYVDITERKRHERRIETLIDNLPGVVYRCRNEKGWPIAEIRGAVEELTGYTAAELEDGGFEERLVHPDDQEAVWREVQAALADGEPFELTYRILTKDGTTRWVWERGQRVAREHRDEDVLEGFITDITERKADERELERQIERLERFASVVSHDLRNPLNVAHGRIELEREANASEHLDAAQEAVERGLDLVHDLLALAREGEQVQEAGPVALSGALERCWQNVETDDATLAVETERTIRADPTRVEQLLENLLRNAVRHGGSDVTVTLGDLPDGFYIEDDGPGIAEPAREKIFQMGYSTDDEGTGFGLNIVREIVAAHGWEIAATDSATGGARFEITGVQDAR